MSALLKIIIPFVIIFATITGKKLMLGRGWANENFLFGYELSLGTIIIILFDASGSFKDFILLSEKWELSYLFLLKTLNNKFVEHISHLILMFTVMFTQMIVIQDQRNVYHYFPKRTGLIIANVTSIAFYMIFALKS